MEECKKYELSENLSCAYLVSKEKWDLVILTKKKLLEVCWKCDEQDTCKQTRRFYRKLA